MNLPQTEHLSRGILLVHVVRLADMVCLENGPFPGPGECHDCLRFGLPYVNRGEESLQLDDPFLEFLEVLS